LDLLRSGHHKRRAPLRYFVFLVFSAVAAFVTSPPAAHAQEIERLTIETASGAHDFYVEVMRTGPERERGLMFRRNLAQDHGMLFDFKVERPVAMWMKNTYLPLDMIFLSKTGTVVGLAENAEPLSEKIIASGAPAYSVLEVNAGTASRISLAIGDRVYHPIFK
jgi:uncharacterized membrane protein (UPF0127 family)